jgi:hypothetical protein
MEAMMDRRSTVSCPSCSTWRAAEIVSLLETLLNDRLVAARMPEANDD